MQSLVCVHIQCLYILSGFPNCLLFSVVMSRCLPSNVSPAGSWPSLLRACGNTPPLIKLMSVEIATFNHFDILGTNEMLFSPSGGLNSVKAPWSVKISTLLGGCFFSPSPPWRNYCSRGVPTKGELYCRLPDICFVPFALCKMPASENQFNLLFGEGVPMLASHCASPAQLEDWLCHCSYFYVETPSQFCLLGLGSGVDARLS